FLLRWTRRHRGRPLLGPTLAQFRPCARESGTAAGAVAPLASRLGLGGAVFAWARRWRSALPCRSARRDPAARPRSTPFDRVIETTGPAPAERRDGAVQNAETDPLGGDPGRAGQMRVPLRWKSGVGICYYA